MADFGVTFKPQAAMPGAAPRPQLQQAIKILSLRLPKRPGAAGVAPSPLLTSPGGAGSAFPNSAVGQTQQVAPGALPSPTPTPLSLGTPAVAGAPGAGAPPPDPMATVLQQLAARRSAMPTPMVSSLTAPVPATPQGLVDPLAGGPHDNWGQPRTPQMPSMPPPPAPGPLRPSTDPGPYDNWGTPPPDQALPPKPLRPSTDPGPYDNWGAPRTPQAPAPAQPPLPPAAPWQEFVPDGTVQQIPQGWDGPGGGIVQSLPEGWDNAPGVLGPYIRTSGDPMTPGPQSQRVQALLQALMRRGG